MNVPVFLYETAFSKLNTQQAQAVTQTEGPVMVLAGPGTGKTEVLAVRIGYILNERQANPTNILCLTYSNAGVRAMRKRLTELIGETANQVEISTFHAFSNNLISKRSSNSFEGKNLITDAQRSMLIEKILFDHHSPSDPSKTKPVSGKKIGNLVKIFATLKQEGLTYEDISKHAEYCIKNVLPFEEKYTKKNNEINAAGKKLTEQILHFSETISKMYAQYCEELDKRNKIEFEDMLGEAIWLLQHNSDLLSYLKETYQYILVDEFQDTNKKQLALLDLLVSETIDPNIFVVGDDDQCIYRFQGASSLNFNWVRNRFRNSLKTIILDTNYRSTSVLLQEAFGLINQNNSRQPEKNQPLLAGNKDYLIANNPLPTFKSYENAEQEACAVAKSIALQLEAGKKATEITVLARRHADFEFLKKWLLLYNVSWQSNQSSKNLLDSFYGRSLFNLIHFIKNQDDSGYNALGFFTQFMLLKQNTTWFVESFLKCRNEKKYNLYEWLKLQAKDVDFFKELSSVIDALLVNRNSQLTEDILDLLNKAVFSGVNVQLLPDEDKAWKEFVHNFLATDTYKTVDSLADLLWYHDQMNLPIRFESEDSALDDHAIILSTIHGSKGLEYDTVYLISCHNKNWEERDLRGMITVPDLLNRYISPEADTLEDMRKLIYVACTRAKEQLHVSVYRKKGSDKAIPPTTLLNAFGESSNIFLERVESIELPEIQCDTYKLQANNVLMELIQERILAFEISPTSTAVWERCQNEFLFTQVLKIGGFYNEKASFGTVVHNVLQRYAGIEIMERNQGLLYSLIEEEMGKQKHLFHSTHFYKYTQYAKWMIPIYLTKHPIATIPSFLEQEYHAVIEETVKIKGKLDRVEVYPEKVQVIDYKTGLSSQTLTPFIDEENPGTQYWRQAMMYLMLVKENFKDVADVRFAFHYPEIENGIFDFDQPENPSFNLWLKKIWNRTKQLEFNQACTDSACIYCMSAQALRNHL